MEIKNKIRKLTFDVDIEKIKSKEQFLELLNKVLEYDFIGFYNSHNIVDFLFRREKKQSEDLRTKK